MENYYKTLGVSENATESEIKNAFRKLAMQHHPDKNNGSKESTELFKKLNQANEILSDKSKRAQYNLTLFQFRKAEEQIRNEQEARKKAEQTQKDRSTRSNGQSPFGSSNGSTNYKNSDNRAFVGVGFFILFFILIAMILSDSDSSPKIQ